MQTEVRRNLVATGREEVGRVQVRASGNVNDCAAHVHDRDVDVLGHVDAHAHVHVRVHVHVNVRVNVRVHARVLHEIALHISILSDFVECHPPAATTQAHSQKATSFLR